MPETENPPAAVERAPGDAGLEWASAYLEHWIEESLEDGPPPPPQRGRHRSFPARGSHPNPHRHHSAPHRPRALHGSFASSPPSPSCVSSPQKSDAFSGEKKSHHMDDSARHGHVDSHVGASPESRGLSRCDASLDVLLGGRRVGRRAAPSIKSDPPHSRATRSGRHGRRARRRSRSLDAGLSRMSLDPPGNCFSSFRRSDGRPLLHVHFLSDGQPNEPSTQHEKSTTIAEAEASKRKAGSTDTSPVRKDAEKPIPTAAGSPNRPKTRIMYLPWKDDRGVEGLYSGEVKLTNLRLLPHGHGLLKYDHDGTTLKSNWIDGIPSREAESVPEKPKTTNRPNSSPRRINSRSQSDASNERPAQNYPYSSEKSSTFYAPDALRSLRSHSSRKTTVPHGSLLAGIPPLPFQPKSFELGDVASSEDMMVETDPAKALESVASLAIHDFAFVHRTDGTWTYAILANFSDKAGERECMRFVVDRWGSTKVVKRKFWRRGVRLVNTNFKKVGQTDAARNPYAWM